MKTPLFRALGPLFLTAVLVLLGTGCVNIPRLTTLDKHASPFQVKVKNDSSLELLVFQHEREPLTVVPPHEVRTVYVNLDYYDQNYSVVLFARPTSIPLDGKKIPARRFVFTNYRYDPVYGSGWGRPQNETYVWPIDDNTFKQNGWFW